MTKDEFYKLYTGRYIKCYNMKELTSIIRTYCGDNLDAWEYDNLSDPNFIKNNHHNEVGIIIYVDTNESIYHGYKDDDVEEFIEAKEILEMKWLNKKQRQSKKMNEIARILDKIYEDENLRETVVPLFMSNPGIGKTEQINAFAKSKGVKMVEMIGSQMSPFEVSGICVPSHTKERMVYYDFDSLLDLKDGDLLFLDELPNSNPSVLNAMLTLIGSRRMISGKKLPKIMIVAAGNPQGMTPMTPQIKERFIWYNLKFDQSSFIKYMINKYDITLSIGEKLSNLIKDEQFTGQNFFTPRSVDKAVNMLIKQVETPYNLSILPILEELIQNTQLVDIELKNREIFKQNECKKWIDIVRIEKNLK